MHTHTHSLFLFHLLCRHALASTPLHQISLVYEMAPLYIRHRFQRKWHDCSSSPISFTTAQLQCATHQLIARSSGTNCRISLSACIGPTVMKEDRKKDEMILNVCECMCVCVCVCMCARALYDVIGSVTHIHVHYDIQLQLQRVSRAESLPMP